jgi:uncharacterized Rossmann fold enzyme
LGRPIKGFAPIFNIVLALQAWRILGILKEIIITALHKQVREQAEKKPKWTTLLIVHVHSQNIKTLSE